MGYIKDKIVRLSNQLYPTGRAFRFFEGSNLEKLHKGLAVSEEKFYNEAVSIRDAILPDNDNFTSDDATDWERRLGMITSLSTPLADRKASIKRKLNQPGVAPAKSNWRYMQQQLQAAGFDVYVYENLFPYYTYDDFYYTKSPDDAAATSSFFFKDNEHGVYEHGEIEHGGSYHNFCANYIDEARDWEFQISADLKSTFYIGGSTIGSFANVLSSRKDEFRQLILTLKPVQNVAFLFINYT